MNACEAAMFAYKVRSNLHLLWASTCFQAKLVAFDLDFGLTFGRQLPWSTRLEQLQMQTSLGSQSAGI